jgi:nucleoside-diphosphate-sugar epimerase
VFQLSVTAPSVEALWRVHTVADPRGRHRGGGRHSRGALRGHLVADLVRRGHRRIRAIDVKPVDDWHQVFPDAENLRRDLREKDACYTAARGARFIFNLAVDMGGMGFIETHKAACMLSVMVNTNMLPAARDERAERYFYSSSACVYPADMQTTPQVVPLKESDALSCDAGGRIWLGKLFSERMCNHFTEDYGLATRVARYHNVYGPFSAYDGGREKAPAAICRKVITALITGERTIEIWGDGEQTRSFMYIDDCVFGTQSLMASEMTARAASSSWRRPTGWGASSPNITLRTCSKPKRRFAFPRMPAEGRLRWKRWLAPWVPFSASVRRPRSSTTGAWTRRAPNSQS